MPALCNESLLFSVIPPGKAHLFPVRLLAGSREVRPLPEIEKGSIKQPSDIPRGASLPRACGEYSHAPLEAQTSKYTLPVSLTINQLLFGNSSRI